MADDPDPARSAGQELSLSQPPLLSQEAFAQLASHAGVHQAIQEGTLKELIASSPALKEAVGSNAAAIENADHETLKYHLLGPSLTKAGQDSVDQKRVSEIIYNASKGSKFFNNEEVKDRNLTEKINRILAKKRQLERLDLASDRRKADDYITQLEVDRDLSQTIVHLDCDAFYAAVEELDRPELKNVPMAVGKGVLTTCNYVARKFGCRSGMAGFVAKKLCPELVSLPLNFDKYTAKAQEVRTVLAQYDPRFQSSSIDEAYLNITEYCQEHDMEPVDAVSQLRAQVFEETKITVSAGIAANAMLAKICSNKNKPNGQFNLASGRAAILAFVRDLPTRKVNGIGRVFERELDALGVKTCGDIYEQRHLLSRLFGEKAFQFLMSIYLGLGATNLRPAEEHERKSVGTESTFRDMEDPAELRAKLRHIAEELEGDLRRTECKGRTLVLKVKLHSYEVLTRQTAPPFAVNKADDLYKYGLAMMEKLMKELPAFKLRLMGLRCTHLLSTKKGDVESFFGLSKAASGDTAEAAAASKPVPRDADGWEIWPAAEFEEAARQERQDELDEVARWSQQHEADADADANANAAPRRHGKELVPNPVPDAPAPAPTEEVWACPICSRPQSADDRLFNAHIDLCLSRQTIAEAVQDTHKDENPSSAAAAPPPPLPPLSMPASASTSAASAPAQTSRKRARSAKVEPAKGNKKLFFA